MKKTKKDILRSDAEIAEFEKLFSNRETTTCPVKPKTETDWRKTNLSEKVLNILFTF